MTALTRLIHNRGRRRPAAFTGIAAVVVVSGLAFTAPAMAAPAVAGHRAVPASAANSLPAGLDVGFTETGQLTTTIVNATIRCSTTPADAVHGTEFGVVLWWIKMVTTWCWNGTFVTSHSTTVTHWTSINFGGAPLVFTCPNGCRENSESVANNMMFWFQDGNTGVAWNVHLWQNEFGNGSWNAGWHAFAYPC